MTSGESDDAKVFTSRYPRWVVAGRTVIAAILAASGALVIVALHVARNIVDQREAMTSLLGQGFADAMVARSWRGGAVTCLLAVTLPWLAAWRSRHSWERMAVTAEGIEVSRGAQTLRAAWRDVRAIERTRGTALSWLRTRNFSVSLVEFYWCSAPAASRWRRRRLTDTAVVRELTERRGIVMVRRWPPWPVIAAALLALPLLLADAWQRWQSPGDARLRTISGTPANDLAALDDYLARWPHDNWARGRRALSLATLGRHAEARAEAERAVEGDPSMEEVWRLRRAAADLSGDAGWAVTSWLQQPALLPAGDTREAFLDPVTTDFFQGVNVGRRLLLAGEVDRARRWFDAAARDAARTPDPPEREGQSARRAVLMVALHALCDVAQGQPERALARLRDQGASGIETLVVTALAQRCLGREADATATLARLEEAEPSSERSAAGQAALVAWLRGESVEMPRTFTDPWSPVGRGSYDAPLFVVAARGCEAPVE